MPKTRTHSPSTKVFLLSCIPPEEKKTYSKSIQRLGGTLSNSEVFKTNCTHLICGKLCRSEKILAACASGKWILKTQYLFDSLKANKWLNEEDYEWCSDDGIDDRFPTSLLIAPRRWRLNYLITQTGSFSGWNVAVLVEKRAKQIVYKRLLAVGGASLFDIKIPITNPEKVASLLTYLFVDDKNAASVIHLVEYGVMVLQLDFLGQYIIGYPTPDPVDYLVRIKEEYVKKPKRIKGINSAIKYDSENSSCFSSPLHANEDDCFIVDSSPSFFNERKPRLRSLQNSKDVQVHAAESSGSQTQKSLGTVHVSEQRVNNGHVLSKSNSTSVFTKEKGSKTSRGKSAQVGKNSRTFHKQLKIFPLLQSSNEKPPEMKQELSNTDFFSDTNVSQINNNNSSFSSYKKNAPDVKKEKSDLIILDNSPQSEYSPSSPDRASQILSIETCSTKSSGTYSITSSTVSTPEDDCFIVEPLSSVKSEKSIEEQAKSVSSDNESKSAENCDVNCMEIADNVNVSEAINYSKKYPKSPTVVLEKIQNTIESVPPLSSVQTLNQVSLTSENCLQCSFSPQVDEREADKAYRKETPPMVTQNVGSVKRKLLLDECDADTLYATVKRLKIDELNAWRPRLPTQRCWNNKKVQRLQEAQSDLIQAHLDESVTDYNIEALSGILNKDHYPPSKTMSFLLRNLLTSSDSFLSMKLFNVLRNILILHPPTSPAIQKVYFSAFKIHSDSQTNHYCLDDEWSFVDQLIRGLIYDGNEMSPTKDVCYVDNKFMLLEFIVTLLEQDFKHFCNQDATIENKLRLPLIAYLLYTPSYIVSVNKRLRDFTAYICDIMKCSMSKEKKLQLKKLYFGIISIIAEYLHMSGRAQKSLFPGLKAMEIELTSVFINDISRKILSVPLDVDVLSNIFKLLTPTWLGLGVCRILLNAFDNFLVPREPEEFKRLNLDLIASDYFYLLPPLTKNCDCKEINGLESSSSGQKNPEHVDQQIQNSSCCGKGKRSTSWLKRNPKGETLLHLACIKNDVEKLRALLQMPGVDVNVTDNAGWTPLHEAANHGSLECVEALLNFVPACVNTNSTTGEHTEPSRKVDLLAAPPNKITALHDAVMNGKFSVCKLLLEHGGPRLLTSKTSLGYTPLNLSRSAEITDLLLSFENGFSESFSQSVSSEANNRSEASSSHCEDDGNFPKDYMYAKVFGNNQVHADIVETKKYIFLLQTLIQSYLSVTELFHLKESDNLTRMLNNFKKETQQTGTEAFHPQETELHDIKEDMRTLRTYPQKIVMFEKHLEKILSASDFQSIQMNIHILKCFIETVSSFRT